MDKVGSPIKITVDLGEYGEELLDFRKSFKMGSVEEGLTKEAALFDWYDGIYQLLKKQIKDKKIFLDAEVSRKKKKIGDKLRKERDKKVYQTEIDAIIEKEESIIVLKEELSKLEYQKSRIGGHLGALQHLHSNLKELSRRERSMWYTTDENVAEDDPEKYAKERIASLGKGKE